MLVLPDGQRLVSNPSFMFFYWLKRSDLKRQLAVDPQIAAFWTGGELQRLIALAGTLAVQQPSCNRNCPDCYRNLILALVPVGLTLVPVG